MKTHYIKILAAEIEVNTHCNLSCSYCPNSNYKEDQLPKNSIDMKTFDSILLNLKDIGFTGRLSYHFYGEPLLHKDLNSLVKKAVQFLDPKVKHVVFTNGTLLTQSRFESLIHAGVNLFLITKHEDTKKIPIDSFTEDFLIKYKKNIIYRQNEAIKKTSRAGLVADYIQRDFDFRTPCYIPSQSIYFTVNGDVIPCFEDYKKSSPMGNIKSDSLYDIWHRKTYVTFRENCRTGKRIKNTLCTECTSDQIIVI